MLLFVLLSVKSSYSLNYLFTCHFLCTHPSVDTVLENGHITSPEPLTGSSVTVKEMGQTPRGLVQEKHQSECFRPDAT
uniref:Secreted protein n=1 Tax=Knipowitschia caucasica TaxID=637954 RepID=A0AAV2K857_KNICA